jgi:hypothetical protein
VIEGLESEGVFFRHDLEVGEDGFAMEMSHGWPGAHAPFDRLLYQFILHIRPQGDNTKTSTTSRFGRLPSRGHGHIWPFHDYSCREAWDWEIRELI